LRLITVVASFIIVLFVFLLLLKRVVAGLVHFLGQTVFQAVELRDELDQHVLFGLLVLLVFLVKNDQL
jgi:hypothetical protein